MKAFRFVSRYKAAIAVAIIYNATIAYSIQHCFNYA